MDLLQQLEIKHPIFLAPMAGVSTPELAAEVSNQGGLGSLGLGANTVQSAREQILKTQTLTEKSFQVNFFCHQPERLNPQTSAQWIEYLRPQFEKFGEQPPQNLNCIYPSFLDNDDFLNVVLETKPKAVSFHFGIPHPHQIQALKDAGIITMVSATNLVEAQAIEAAGIDIIIAQGIEAGGHRGIFNKTFDAAIKTSDLVHLIVKHCKQPVVAAGGIMNGAQARHMLSLGATAVQLGTAFVQCPSSNASVEYRKALFNESVTQISASLSGRPARGLLNHWHTQIDLPNRPPQPEYPYTYDLAKQLNAIASKNKDYGFGAFWAGSNVSQIRELDAADLVNQLVVEMLEDE
ncbi:NAD(P)H-dependent flavin oxidoreductase [Acinetobacter pittii]|uniref:NAD(P)H-dependent flavin oxidoreductase n=1 Tax=Acinetobacter pittii TaxID=48296 RepID=UPI001F2FD316|nr:nitronate monooxygenase [Acinetobacter pittii]MCE6236107.1 nitronate monooxygenase [Acinetobacter pittii]MCE6690692.1 nitronate monooxygenase [Acinetobacter pittii]MCE6698144.1 nitronate monooxygenase [Acinetobacter pittii]MCU4399896.1 nitronate monooxygenase [Acinetobacter pittii]MCU4403434.1 nitronate monooxygenase [Acinetobacter pittii]